MAIEVETMETVSDFIFRCSKITANGDYNHLIKRHLPLGRKVITTLDSILKSRDITLPTKVCLCYGFSSSHVWMWELNYEESWVPKNWWIWSVMLEKTLESPLDCKKIQPVHPKGNQFWIFIGWTEAEAEAPIIWSPDVRSWCIGNDRDAGKYWRQDKGRTEDKMAGWHHRLDGHEFELVMDREARGAAIPGVAKSRIRLSHWTELNW